jgi:Caspase domain
MCERLHALMPFAFSPRADTEPSQTSKGRREGGVGERKAVVPRCFAVLVLGSIVSYGCGGSPPMDPRLPQAYEDSRPAPAGEGSELWRASADPQFSPTRPSSPGIARTAAPTALAYRAPSSKPPGPARARVAGEPDGITRDIADRLAAGGILVTRAADGIVVGEYHGDPTPYVDCGSLTYDEAGRRTLLNAATARSSFRRWVGPGDVSIQRDLLLNVRQVAQVSRTAEGSEAEVGATYVLTRNNQMHDTGGKELGVNRQTISFASDGRGQFRDKRTVCQANGRLEDLALGTRVALAEPAPGQKAPEAPAPAEIKLAAPTPAMQALPTSAPIVIPADERVALVIGNSRYEDDDSLPNTLNDARAVAEVLGTLGFTVERGIDLDGRETEAALRRFSRLLEDADVGLFYYAGHGLQVHGTNYIVPVDAKIDRESDLLFDAVELNSVLRLLEERPRTSLVFLDACRDNPFARNLARSMGASRAVSVGSGLAQMQSGIGTLIAYATQPNNVALDGTEDGRNSPFTRALVDHIATPGIEVRQMLSRVRKAVIEETDGAQVPWDHSSLIGDFYFVAPTS